MSVSTEALVTVPLRVRAEIGSYFAAGHQARWQGASDEHTLCGV